MLSLSKHTDYALIALAHLHSAGALTPASQIAARHGLPLPMVMILLKRLQRGGLVRSVRGVQGGYELATDLGRVSLYDLMASVQQPSRARGRLAIPRGRPRPAPPEYPALQALQNRMESLLRRVSVLDLVVPGRRIDVPVENLRAAGSDATAVAAAGSAS
jgi:Rrf2 family protein